MEMPYCPECGIHYLQPNSTCVSCGRDLSEASNSPDPQSETFGKSEAPVPNETVIDFGEFRPQVDSHLGKGLVKPQSVEVGMDGFHFKYDQPPQKFVKSEALKDKIVEFRVTAPEEPPAQFLAKEAAAPEEPSGQFELETAGPEEESGQFYGRETPEPEKSPEPSFVEETAGPLEVKEQVLTGEPASETAPVESPAPEKPEASGNVVPPETMAEPKNPVEPDRVAKPETKTPQEVEPVAETEVVEEETETEYPLADDEQPYAEPMDEADLELPEPELKGLEEPETLWEGKGSWYGFGAKTQYRLTNQSVVIVEPYSYRFTEFELALISNVKLSRNWLMKLLGIGDISMSVNGLPEPGLTLKGIREPEKVKRLIEDLVNV
jgi:hypothetical protein